jgi:hypothetical protein
LAYFILKHFDIHQIKVKKKYIRNYYLLQEILSSGAVARGSTCPAVLK